MDISRADRRHCWHPFTQHETEVPPRVLARAQGASLFDAQGEELLDLISSWWTCLHGHSHPPLVAALKTQAEEMAHVMFAGFTHAPAAGLACELAGVLPGDLSRVFFSDDGSTAVEVALKAAFQYWRNRGTQERRLFISFEGGYHGDTLGAMSAGRGSGFFSLYDGLMCEVATLPFAATWMGDEAVEAREAEALAAFEALLDRQGRQVAALIMEPLLQGAGGMRMCRPAFVRALVERARAAGILVIMDEVATGFGRTGTLFACEQAGVVPDFICLAKGLTGGMMPMSVTVAREEIFSQFLGPDFSRALAHGHSFTAHPLACAVARRSLEILVHGDGLTNVARIAARHEEQLPRIAAHPKVARVRQCGTVLAFDLAAAGGGYKSTVSLALRDWYLAHGLNIRPLGPVVYLMPPYCITDDELARAYDGLLAGLDAVG